MDVFFKKFVLKVSQKSQEKNLCWSLYLSAPSNLAPLETPTQVSSC